MYKRIIQRAKSEDKQPNKLPKDDLGQNKEKRPKQNKRKEQAKKAKTNRKK